MLFDPLLKIILISSFIYTDWYILKYDHMKEIFIISLKRTGSINS